MAKQHYIIPIFVPHRGCPHQCVFCNQKEIAGVATQPSRDMVSRTIGEYLSTIPLQAGVTAEVAFYGGSFTAMSREEQEVLLKPAAAILKAGLIRNIRVSTRPDCISLEGLDFLRSYGVGIIELGVQSMNPEVLVSSGRGHTPDDVRESSRLIKEQGFALGLQMMVGLPGDSREISLATGMELVSLEPDFVRIYPVLVVEGTPLAEAYRQGSYLPLALEEAVETCAELLLVFNRAGIPVIRLGLQPSQEIDYDGKVLAGPFHPAFRELVESRVAYRQVADLLEKAREQGLEITGELVLAVPARDVSIIRGQRNANLSALQKEYDLSGTKIIIDETMKRGEIGLYSLDGKSLNLISQRSSLGIPNKKL